MENPYESLPMGTDLCDGIRDICPNTVKLMTEMRDVAKSTNYWGVLLNKKTSILFIYIILNIIEHN